MAEATAPDGGAAWAMAVGKDWKGIASVVIYAVAIPLAFVNRWISGLLYVTVAMVWLIPDSRIEKKLHH